MVEAYWNIGRMIVEEEQQGKERAEYGRRVDQEPVHPLNRQSSERVSRNAISGTYASFTSFFRPKDHKAKKCTHLCAELTWSHYRLLMRVEKPDARAVVYD